MTVPDPVEAGVALPRSSRLRARLQPHLDADPDLLAALLIHLELARDDCRPRSRLRRPAASRRTDASRGADRDPAGGLADSSPDA